MDIATYKAEFFSHYYENKWRPLKAYAFGQIDRWARLASGAPKLANFLSHAAGMRHLLHRTLGLTSQRKIPRLAAVSFRRWARRHADEIFRKELVTPAVNGRDVILWVDTFNNYFHPETSRAALSVLEQGDFRVQCPETALCCGRPLYDFGMLKEAKQYLQKVMNTLSVEIDAGLPIVVLEPSCASVFRDELHNLFPKDASAQRLRRQTFLLSEFLEKKGTGYHPPPLKAKVLLHGHCHHKALMKMNDEESLLRRMGLDLQTLDSGCCGMAGPFGFEKEKFAVSQSVGERVLLPAVRSATPETVIVSDGFSCREQIEQATGRKPMHLAEVLQLALQRKSRS